MKSRFLPLAAALALAPHSSLAADTELPAVVITATATPVSADSTLASVTVIGRDTLESARGQDLGDVLRLHAGIDVVRSGGRGQQTSVFLRGANSNQTLVLVDGVRINSGTYGGVNLQNLGLENIERIEVVRGPRSSLYGSDAIGGVINIITRQSTRNATAIRLSASRDETASGSFRQDLRAGAFSASVNAGGFYTDGYPLFSNNNAPRGYKNSELGAGLGWGDGRNSLRASYQKNSGRSEYLGFGNTLLSQDFVNDVSRLEARAGLGDNLDSSLRVSLARDRIDQIDSTDFAHTERREVRWQNDLRAGAHLLTLGASYSDDDVSAVIFGGGYGDVINHHAVFLQDQFTAGALSLLLAARHESSEQFGDHQTGELATGLTFAEGQRLRASVSTGFRAPDGNQLYGFGGNPSLRPEESRNLEIGSEHHAGAWRFGTSVYRNDVDELIDYDFGTAQMQNIRRARLEGIELTADFTQGHWSWRNQAGYLRPRDRDNDQDLSRRPRRSLGSQLEFRQERYRVGGEVIAKSRNDNSGFDSLVIPGHAVFNLHGQLQLDKNAHVALRIDNVADKTYGLAAAGGNGFYLAPPRTTTLTLALDF